MAYKYGPWGQTRGGKRTTTVNVSIAVVLLLFMLWKVLID
jgi:hypothetical protein